MTEQKLKRIEGGVTYPKGFAAYGIHCGLRKNKSKRDLAMIAADVPCSAAAIYTTNKVYGAPITVTREHLKNGIAQAVICNSGNANTCCPDGVEKAQAMCEVTAKALGISADDVIVASTGVIGMPLPLEPIVTGIPVLAEKLTHDGDGSYAAAMAIMTTDTRKKEICFETVIDGKKVYIGGIAKGSGMIHPNMATMLGFITTDVSIDSAVLGKLLKKAADKTFNMVSVDGDTSTNDMLCILASGLAENEKITDEASPDALVFYTALEELCRYIARHIARDGEGATKLIECRIRNFSSEDGAKVLAKSVINSPLVKAAMFGADANWGRVLCALGYAGVDFDPKKVDVSFISNVGEINVCRDGGDVGFDEAKAKSILLKDEVIIDVDMKCGSEEATAWGCDLSYEYVRINGDYRS